MSLFAECCYMAVPVQRGKSKGRQINLICINMGLTFTRKAVPMSMLLITDDVSDSRK